MKDQVKGSSEKLRLAARRRIANSANPALWDLVALRAQGYASWAARGHVFRRRAVREYLEATAEPKLQIGSGGSPLPGWLNSDLLGSDVYVDLIRPLPFPDGSFSYVYGEHVIEHVSEAAGLRLLRELHRVLHPGGVLRLATPDLKQAIRLYEDRHELISFEEYRRHLNAETWEHERPCQVFNTAMRHWGHQYVYDEEDLIAKLLGCGFRAVERAEVGESRHPALHGIERHLPHAPRVNAAESMYLEAVR